MLVVTRVTPARRESHTMWERIKEKRNEGGFTLIELLIVIIILAILAAIVVFAVGSSGQNSAVASCNSDAKSVETALEAYKASGANGGNFPASPPAATAWTAATYATYYDALTTAAANGTGPWLRSAPGTTYYTVLFDSSGQIWIEPPNTYTAYAAANDFDLVPTICSTTAVA